jgi:hypothetical protein
MSSATAEGALEQIMTDYQFRTILKMVLDIVRRTKTVDEIEQALVALIEDSEKDGHKQQKREVR